MERPTPVSSLLHSSTMVVARIYLTIKFSYCFNFIFTLEYLQTVEKILKKVVAFSTTSQLRLMLTSYRILNFRVLVLHITFHAFSKSIIFISTRLIIHIINNFQDFRNTFNFNYFQLNFFKILIS